MDIKDNPQTEPTHKSELSEKPDVTSFKAKTNEQLNEENPSRKKRRQATEAELNNPLHGLKLAVLLERLVEYYGWAYLADRTNIRCFKYNPNMKSSLGFLRKTKWAKEFVEDIYLDMLDDIERAKRLKRD
jgi:hypothetical protein